MKTVRRKLADGTIKEYHYEKGKKVALPGSIGALVQEYRKTPEFLALKPNTKKNYFRAMKHMEPLYYCAITDIKRRHVIKLRNELAKTPALANQVRLFFSVLMQFAVDMEYCESNPAARIKNLAAGHYDRWSDEQIEYALTHMPERFRRAILLALYTGQRQGDLVKMRWDEYDGESVYVAQEKTGEKLWIFCHAALRAELEAWKRDRTAVTILTDSLGTPYKHAGTFATVFSAERKKHPCLNGLVFHGLRKTAAAKLAEAGCSSLEIKAITGHRSLEMVELYTRQADQKRRSRSAVVKLENAGKILRKDGDK